MQTFSPPRSIPLVLTLFVTFLLAGLPARAATLDFSLSKSTVIATPQTAVADGQQKINIRVTVVNDAQQPVIGKMVVLIPSQPGAMAVSAPMQTDVDGMAYFTITSALDNTFGVYASVDGSPLIQQPVIYFTAPHCPFTPGTLIKLPDDGDPDTQTDSAVYYYGKDCKRHAFPNVRVFNSWYTNFENVHVISASEMADRPLGLNVTYKPGARLVKFQTLPKVYAVSRSGVLHWLTTETIASTLYGNSWNLQVDDIPDTFYENYSFGDDVVSAGQYFPQNERDNTPTIDYSM